MSENGLTCHTWLSLRSILVRGKDSGQSLYWKVCRNLEMIQACPGASTHKRQLVSASGLRHNALSPKARDISSY